MNVPENKTRLISWPTSGPIVSCLEISFKILKTKIWLIFTFFVKSMTKQVKQNCPPLYRKKMNAVNHMAQSKTKEYVIEKKKKKSCLEKMPYNL